MMKGLTAFVITRGKAPALFLALGLGLTVSTLWQPASADTVLNITGNIKASPCTISLPSGGMNVDLGQKILASSMAEAGSSSDWKPFSIALTACPASTSEATMTVNGTPDETESDMYANTGSATQVQIQLQTSDGTALGNAAQKVQNIDTPTRSTTFDMRARAYSAQGKVTPGTIVGSVQVTFTYQ